MLCGICEEVYLSGKRSAGAGSAGVIEPLSAAVAGCSMTPPQTAAQHDSPAGMQNNSSWLANAARPGASQNSLQLTAGPMSEPDRITQAGLSL